MERYFMLMKRLVYMVLVLFPIIITGCDKNEDNTGVTSILLAQTIWNGSMTSYDTENTPGITTIFILEFTSETQGKCVLQELDEIQDFQYTIKESMLSINGSYAVAGDWHIIEHSHNQIVLQSYRPQKTIITLQKM